MNSVFRRKRQKETPFLLRSNRDTVLKNLQEAQQKKKGLLSELEAYRECDPDVLNDIKKQTQVSKESANRWTDNVFSIKSWIKNKFSFEESVIDKQFEIPADFDYMD